MANPAHPENKSDRPSSSPSTTHAPSSSNATGASTSGSSMAGNTSSTMGSGTNFSSTTSSSDNVSRLSPADEKRRSSSSSRSSTDMNNEFMDKAKDTMDEFSERSSEYYNQAQMWMRDNYGRVIFTVGAVAAVGLAGYWFFNRNRQESWDNERLYPRI